jgi:hypothetical protein
LIPLGLGRPAAAFGPGLGAQDPGLTPGWLSTAIGFVQPWQAAQSIAINLEDRLGSGAQMGRTNDLTGFLIAVKRSHRKHRQRELGLNLLKGV